MKRLSILAVLGLAALDVSGVNLPRTTARFALDGDLSDPVWTEALRIDQFYELVPGDNVTPPVATTAWVALGEREILVAFRCSDPDPEQLRAPFVARDRVLGDQDFVQIDIDAQDDGASSTFFRANPRGIQTDGVYTEATRRTDLAPDFEFDTAAKIGADGWTLEMRIPFTALRYPPGEPQNWRVIINRLYLRGSRYEIASRPLERSSSCFLCDSLVLEGLDGLPTAGTTTLTPYVSGRSFDAASGAVSAASEGGFDLKWLPRPALSIDATYNPDYSQIESDAAPLAVNDRFAIFFPEKRPFFMEGNDLLSSPLQAIHTRTITAPDWGARMTARPGNHAFTFLVTRDAGGGSRIVPGGAFSSLERQPIDATTAIGRYRISRGGSSAGMLLTSSSSDDTSYSNLVAGPDVSWRPNRGDRISAQLLASRSEEGESTLDGTAAILSWDRTLPRVDWNVTMRNVTDGFRADNGFIPQAGVRAASVRFGARFYPEGLLTRIQPEIHVEQTEESGGGIVSRGIVPKLALEGWRSSVAQFELHLDETGRGRDGSLIPQDYATALIRFLPGRKLPYLRFLARYGDEIDVERSRLGSGSSFEVYASAQPVDHLQAELSARSRRLEIDGDRLFSAESLRAQLTWTFGQRSFVRGIGESRTVDWNRALAPEKPKRDGSIDTSLLYGFRLNWQTILYAGYADTRPVHAGGTGDANREYFLKVSYALRPGESEWFRRAAMNDAEHPIEIGGTL